MKRVIRTFFVLSVVLVFSACEYATIHPPVQDPNVPVSFKNDLQPLFESQNCVPCHKTGGTLPDLTAGNSYQSIMSNNMVVPGNAAASVFYQKISSGGSMSAYSSAELNGKTLNWINQGAKDN
jgi:hypothetical protein